MQLKRLIFIIAGLVLLAVLLLAGSGLVSRIGGQAGDPTPEVEEAPLEIAVRARGEVVPVLWADLSFDTTGPVAEWFVAEGDVVAAGTPLGRLAVPNQADLERSVVQAELDLRQAQLALERLQKPADEADVEQARHAVEQAAAAISVAQLDLAAAHDSALLNETLEDARKVFEDTQHKYAVRLEQYERGEVSFYIVDLARQRYDDAKLALSRIQQQGDLEVENARNALDRARQDHQEAQDNLARLLEGTGPLDLETAQLDVREAQLAVEEARSNLAETTLVAPFEGTIVSLHLRPHDWVEPGTVAVTLADLATLRIQTTDLDEWGAAHVDVGSRATLVLNAFDDKTLTGHVTEVDLRGERLPAGDVVYRAVIELDTPDPDLRWGMTARITFPLE
jgi:multidrug efflux pump subunit AcrA (membrane-fusion protein)